MEALTIVLFSSVIIPILKYIWPTLLFPFSLFGIKINISYEKSIVTSIKKNIKFSTIIDEDDLPLDFFFGWCYIGYIDRKDATKGEVIDVVYVICTKNTFKILSTNKNESKTKVVKSWDREGNYFWGKYHNSKLAIKDYNLRDSQEQLLLEIQNHYFENKSCVAYIYGEMETGKSTIYKYLAERLNGSVCRTFDPTEPGDTFTKLLRRVDPEFNNPLIVVFDECSKLIIKIRDDKIEPHKHIPIQIRGRAKWNEFLDDFGGGSYANCILLLISNDSPKVLAFNEHAPLLRKNRVNLYFKLSKEKVDIFKSIDEID
jgi:hypothetical protein